MTQVTVQYERKYSDGNYGSEGLSMSWTVTYDDGGEDYAADTEVVSARAARISPGRYAKPCSANSLTPRRATSHGPRNAN